MITATIFEAKTTLSELIRQVQNGETVVITSGREKTPVATLAPVKPTAPPKRLGLYDPNVQIPAGARDSLFQNEPDALDHPTDPLNLPFGLSK